MYLIMKRIFIQYTQRTLKTQSENKPNEKIGRRPKQIPHRDLNRYLTKEDVEMANNHRNAEHHILLGNCKLK